MKEKRFFIADSRKKLLVIMGVEKWMVVSGNLAKFVKGNVLGGIGEQGM